MPIPKSGDKRVTVEVVVDPKKFMRESLVLGVVVYPDGTTMSDTVPISKLQDYVKVNLSLSRALIVKFSHGEVMLVSEGGCSKELLERVIRTVYNMSIGTEDSAPYH